MCTDNKTYLFRPFLIDSKQTYYFSSQVYYNTLQTTQIYLVFLIVCRSNPEANAFDVAACLVECPENTLISIPDINRTFLFHLPIV